MNNSTIYNGYGGQKSARFGHVSVYKTMRYGADSFDVEINWSAIGSTSIEYTETFVADLQAAITLAKEWQAETVKVAI